MDDARWAASQLTFSRAVELWAPVMSRVYAMANRFHRDTGQRPDTVYLGQAHYTRLIAAEGYHHNPVFEPTTLTGGNPGSLAGLNIVLVWHPADHLSMGLVHWEELNGSK